MNHTFPTFIFSSLIAIFFFSSCSENKLPILGERSTKVTLVDGKQVVDTVYPTIPPFRFMDQDGNYVTNETFMGKVYVADFVFLSCETICPKLNQQMKRMHDLFLNDPDVYFLSHTVDPDHDTLPRIKAFMDAHQIKTSKWHFVRSTEDSTYEIATHGYFSTAYRDSAGEYVHSGGMLLIDRKQRVRGVYDGTQQFTVDQLIKDIGKLVKEKE